MNYSSSTVVRQHERSEPARIRLEYLDGVRGFAALWVVLHHAFMEYARHADTHVPMIVRRLLFPLFNGEVAVDVFIVLSGYCLMMPVVRQVNLSLNGGLTGFIKRRSFRILPPYYAALVLCILLEMAFTHFKRNNAVHTSMTVMLAPGDIISHILLMHDFFSRWITQIDYPMWSVAIEWHIYFVFAIVLLPLVRMFNIWVLLPFAIVVSLLIAHFFNYPDPEFLSLFAAGSIGAWINFSKSPTAERINAKTNWAAIGTAATFCYVVTLLSTPIELWNSSHLLNCMCGLATASLIVWWTRELQINRCLPKFARHFETPVFEKLGAFSYSLYLIHAPILKGMHIVLDKLHLPVIIGIVSEELIGVPLALIVAWYFHLAFERPFLVNRTSKVLTG